jgi:hypothetical protein
MNALMLFSAYMALVYVPWDLFVKDVAEDEEVWFGVVFTGWWAKLLALPHWAIYAAGAYGLWRMRPWMWPWAALYAAQVAIGMALWPILERGGWSGTLMGAVAGAVFLVPTVALWRARERFQGHGDPASLREPLRGARSLRTPLRGARSLRERYGDWALVTGASSGIGAEFARALARGGVSLVLSARREERLEGLAAELEKAHAISTRVVPADLEAPEGAERLADAVADLEIAILVNNAGFGYAGRFDGQETARQRAMVQVNCVAPVLLTSRLLPAMRRRGRGAVIFVGSVAGAQPLPLHALYSATKSFDNLLGEALWAELRGTGVDVLSLLPGPTATEFRAVAGEVPHEGEPAANVVQTAFDALGRQPSVISGWFNWLRANVGARLFPRSVLVLIAKAHMEQQTPPEVH